MVIMNYKLLLIKNLNSKKGLVLAIILSIVFCASLWLVSVTYSISKSRVRIKHASKSLKAYFMARSALQHFFTKWKNYQKHAPEVINNLESCESEKSWKVLSQAFIEDIIKPAEISDRFDSKTSYSIKDFKILSKDLSRSEIVLEVIAEGRCDNVVETIKRTVIINR